MRSLATAAPICHWPISTGEAVQAVSLVSSIEEPQVAELLRRGQLAVEPGDGGSSSIDDGAVAGEHHIETVGGSENFALRLVNAARPQLPDRLDHLKRCAPVAGPPGCLNRQSAELGWRSDADFPGRGDVTQSSPNPLR